MPADSAQTPPQQALDTLVPCAPQLEHDPEEAGAAAEEAAGSPQYRKYICDGSGFSRLELWELARVVGIPVSHLAETEATATWTMVAPWWANGNTEFSIWPGGRCWSNPRTFFNTSWATTWCPGPVVQRDIQGGRFDVAKHGAFVNFDFPLRFSEFMNFQPRFPLVRTDVEITAAVFYTPASGPGWGHSLNINSENNFLQTMEEWILLAGRQFGMAQHTNCDWECDPPQSALDECAEYNAEQEGTGEWDYDACECVRSASPIVVDVDNDGLAFTSVFEGVMFDLLANGRKVLTSWTRGDADDAFLALDRNGNGLIDGGAELFGNRTMNADAFMPGTKRHRPNGFLALSAFDAAAAGGNEDGQISEADAIYGSLRLWHDTNHDGASQAAEMTALAEAGIRAISLRYVPQKARDEFGNLLRFRSRVTMDRSILEGGVGNRQAVDVFFRYVSR